MGVVFIPKLQESCDWKHVQRLEEASHPGPGGSAVTAPKRGEIQNAPLSEPMIEQMIKTILEKVMAKVTKALGGNFMDLSDASFTDVALNPKHLTSADEVPSHVPPLAAAGTGDSHSKGKSGKDGLGKGQDPGADRPVPSHAIPL